MIDRLSRMTVPALVCCFALAAAFVAVVRPGYLTNPHDLELLIFAQVIVAAVWKYRQVYFPMMLLVFLLAGVNLPFASGFTTGRWVVLGIGALVGCVIYLSERMHHFTGFHLMALFCVGSALVSVTVSSYATLALLKTLSLMLLFAYCGFGARVAVKGREEAFFSGLLTGCEGVTYLSAASYFGLHYHLFGNPNSLGAIMGIAVVPLLLWGLLVAEAPAVRQRRLVALAIAVLLLLSSFARAGITAAAVTFFLLCFSLRRYRLLVKGAALGLLLAVFVLAFVSPEQNDVESSTSVVSAFVYKGKREGGMFGSRRSAWQQTMAVVRENPWFGSGFGTSLTGVEEQLQSLTLESAPQVTREHGNSYLALLEWMGLLGVLPFVGLLILVGANVARVVVWMRRTLDPRWPMVPLAMVMAAGLVHAAFEDWMFAAGYYLCPLYWSLAFVCIDYLPAVREQYHNHSAAMRVSGSPEFVPNQ